MGLQEYQEKHQTKLFKKHFVFFAFSNEQLHKQLNRNFKYASLGNGMYAPSLLADTVIKKLNGIYDKAIASRQAKESNRDIIWYELGNYETQFSDDLDPVFDALKHYKGITEDDIRKVYSEYYDYCCKHDMF